MLGKKKNEDKLTALGSLVSGLPLPEETKVSVEYFKDHLLLSTVDKKTFKLSMDKITSIQCVNSSGLKETTGSFGGALVGGALFGVAGAVVGATKKTKKYQLDFYLIISYEDKQIVMHTPYEKSYRSIESAFKATHNVSNNVIL